MLRSLILGWIALSPGLAMADRVECSLSEPCPRIGICKVDRIELNFFIDHNQFAAPLDVNDPPRRKVTLVRLGDEAFLAEPLIIGDVRGFWRENASMNDRMFTMHADGSGVYSEGPSGVELVGHCEVSE